MGQTKVLKVLQCQLDDILCQNEYKNDFDDTGVVLKVLKVCFKLLQLTLYFMHNTISDTALRIYVCTLMSLI